MKTPTNIQQFLAFIQNNAIGTLLPQNLPKKWLLRLSDEIAEAHNTRLQTPIPIRIAVLSMKERRPVKQREVDRIERRYEALDVAEWYALYEQAIIIQALDKLQTGDKHQYAHDTSYRNIIENPPTLDTFFDKDRYRSIDATETHKETLSKFHYQVPVRVAYAHEDPSIYHFGAYIAIRGDKRRIDSDMAELAAIAKLCEKRPLLCNFIFAKSEFATQQMVNNFTHVAKALQSVWAHQVLAKHSTELYNREIMKTAAIYRAYTEAPEQIRKDSQTPEQYFFLVGCAAILLDSPSVGGKENLTLFNPSHEEESNGPPFLEGLKEFSKRQPSPHLYAALYNRLPLPYAVGIRTHEDGQEYYYAYKKQGQPDEKTGEESPQTPQKRAIPLMDALGIAQYVEHYASHKDMDALVQIQAHIMHFFGSTLAAHEGDDYSKELMSAIKTNLGGLLQQYKDGQRFYVPNADPEFIGPPETVGKLLGEAIAQKGNELRRRQTEMLIVAFQIMVRTTSGNEAQIDKLVALYPTLLEQTVKLINEEIDSLANKNPKGHA